MSNLNAEYFQVSEKDFMNSRKAIMPDSTRLDEFVVRISECGGIKCM